MNRTRKPKSSRGRKPKKSTSSSGVRGKVTRRIEAFLNGIDWLFQVNQYDKKLSFPDRDKEEKEDMEGEVLAEVVVDEKYQVLVITIYPCFLKSSLAEQRRVLLHELCHTITNAPKACAIDLLNGKLVVEDKICDANEMATSKIENILDGLLRGKLLYAKEAYADYINKGVKK